MRAKEEMVRQGVQVDISLRNEKLTWTICKDIPKPHRTERHPVRGIADFDFNNLSVRSDGKNWHADLSKLFQHLWPGNMKLLLQKLNELIKSRFNGKVPGTKNQVMHPISHREFLVFLGIMILARTEGVPGGNLWKLGGKTEGYRDHLDLTGKYMTKTRHSQIMDCVSYLWADEGKEGLDEWWQIVNLPKLFNENR